MRAKGCPGNNLKFRQKGVTEGWRRNLVRGLVMTTIGQEKTTEGNMVRRQ